MPRRIITHKNRPSIIKERERANLPPLMYRKLATNSAFVDGQSVAYNPEGTAAMAKAVKLDKYKYVKNKRVRGMYALLIEMHKIDGDGVLFGCRFQTSEEKWRSLPLLWIPSKHLVHMDGNDRAKAGLTTKRETPAYEIDEINRMFFG